MAQGSKPKDAPVTREELERALRHSNALIADLRGELLTLGAQVVTLNRLLERRGSVTEEEVLDELPAMLEKVQNADADPDELRPVLGSCTVDKYKQPSPPTPCEELFPVCGARCCQLSFALSTQDLNEGAVRWDYLRPYAVLQRASDGLCVHNQPDTGRCGVYEQRPHPCRAFDCREDPRIWLDYEKRIIAPDSGIYDEAEMAPSDTVEAERARTSRAEARRTAAAYERLCLVGLRGTREDQESD